MFKKWIRVEKRKGKHYIKIKPCILKFANLTSTLTDELMKLFKINKLLQNLY
jgi:hypothetical protein